MPRQTLLTDHEYFMGIAMAVRQRANCRGNRVGSVAVLNGRVVSTGYNGTPHGMTNCMDGGCRRCLHRDKYPSGTAYDLCICVHAEQNVLLSAARFGIALAGATLYTTMRPCFGCLKEMLQARVEQIVYLHDWVYPDPEVNEEYNNIQSHFKDVYRVEMDDPQAEWAVSSRRKKA